MNNENQTASNILLLLKRKAANVDELLKKQEKKEKQLKEQKHEIERLRKELLIKDEAIKRFQNDAEQDAIEKAELQRLLNENKCKESIIVEKDQHITNQVDMIEQKENIIKQKKDIIRQKEDAVFTKNDELKRNEGTIREKNNELIEFQNNIQSKNKAIRDKDEIIRKVTEANERLQKQIDELTSTYSSQSLLKCVENSEQAREISQKRSLGDIKSRSLNSNHRHPYAFEENTKDFTSETIIQPNKASNSIFDIEGIALQDKSSNIEGQETSTNDHDKSINNIKLQDIKKRSGVKVIKRKVPASCTSICQSETTESGIPISPFVHQTLSADELSDAEMWDSEHVSSNFSREIINDQRVQTHVQKVTGPTKQYTLQNTVLRGNLRSKEPAVLENTSTNTTSSKVAAPGINKSSSLLTSKKEENKKSQSNIGVKFVAPGRKKSLKTRTLIRPKVANFTRLGRLDVNSSLPAYKHEKKPPHDLVLENDFISLDAKEVLERIRKIEDDLSNIKERGGCSTPPDKFKMKVMSHTNRDTNPKIVATRSEKMGTLDASDVYTKEKKKRRKILDIDGSQLQNHDQSNVKDLDNKEHESIPISGEKKTSKRNRTKRKFNTLEDRNASVEETRPPAKASSTLLHNQQTVCNKKARILPLNEDVWNPERFARLDTAKASILPKESARARAAAVLAKKPIKQARRNDSKDKSSTVLLAEDLNISDSSDQESTSPVKKRCDSVCTEEQLYSYYSKTTNEINDSEKTQTEATSSDLKLGYKKPNAFKPRKKDALIDMENENIPRFAASDNEEIQPTIAPKSSTKLNTESNKASVNHISQLTHEVELAAAESTSTAKTFKHKKFDSAEFIPLGRSYSTLLPGTERYASSIDKNIKASKPITLETNTSSPTKACYDTSKHLVISEKTTSIPNANFDSVIRPNTPKKNKYSNFIFSGFHEGNTSISHDENIGKSGEDTLSGKVPPQYPNSLVKERNNTFPISNQTQCKQITVPSSSTKIKTQEQTFDSNAKARESCNDSIHGSNSIHKDTVLQVIEEARNNVNICDNCGFENDSQEVINMHFNSCKKAAATKTTCAELNRDTSASNKSIVENVMTKISNQLTNKEQTYLGSMLNNFESEKRDKIKVLQKRKSDIKKGQGISEEINVNLIKGQLGRLWKRISKEAMENIVKQMVTLCTKPDFTGLSFRYLLVQCIYMEVRDEKSWEDVHEVANYAPLMTDKQGKLLALLISLHEKGMTLDNGEKETIHIIEDLLRFIRYSIFGKDSSGLPRMQSFKISQMANLTRMFMALVRFVGDERTARMFLFDIMFFRNPRSHVMINVFFDTWPEILFWTGNAKTVIDPLLETLIWMIYNTGPATSLADMKVYETRDKLKNLCGFHKPQSTGDDLIKHLIEQTEHKIDNSSFKESTAKSLLLLAKWQEWKWSHNHIISRLLEVMQKCWDLGSKEAIASKPQQLLTWVIDCIGNVSRIYPVEGREHLLDIFKPIQTILTNTENPELLTAKLEDSCLRALIWTGHHLQLQVAKFLISWKPLHPQSTDTMNLVRNFVGTRALKYSQKTVRVYKKKKVYETLNTKHSG